MIGKLSPIRRVPWRRPAAPSGGEYGEVTLHVAKEGKVTNRWRVRLRGSCRAGSGSIPGNVLLLRVQVNDST